VRRIRPKNVQIILVVQVILARRKLAATNRRHAAVVHVHVIFAQTRQTLLGSRAKTLSQSNHEQQRSDPPRDAKHCEEEAKFVRPHGTQDLAEAVDKSPHKPIHERRANKVPICGPMVTVKTREHVRWGPEFGARKDKETPELIFKWRAFYTFARLAATQVRSANRVPLTRVTLFTPTSI
jgi:hypothetical protein